MQYNTLDDLPGPVRHHLPHHAQEIYRAAFNNAWQEYTDPTHHRDGTSHEEAAARVAWTAVERVFTRTREGAWVRSR
ncbi:MAG: ChaB family protein [Propioniciclava sp.]